MTNQQTSGIACFHCPARGSALCSALSDTDIPVLFRAGHQVKLEAGAYLYCEGDANPYVYNLTHGLMMLERLASDGRRQVMAFVYPGDFIGLAPEGHYTVSAKGLTQARLCRFPMTALEMLFPVYPELERRVRKIGNLILNHALDQVFVLGRKTAAERLAFFFLYLTRRQHVADQKPVRIDLPMTRMDIADFLGVTVETVSRAFARLRRDGLIRMPNLNRVEIPDLARLEKAADSYKP